MNLSAPVLPVGAERDATAAVIDLRRTPSGRGRFIAALGVATMAHAGVLGAYLLVLATPHGHEGRLSDAIDVTLIDSRVLEARAPDRLVGAPPVTPPAVSDPAPASHAGEPELEPGETPSLTEPVRVEPPRETGAPQAVDVAAILAEDMPAADAPSAPAATAAPGVARAYASSVVQALAKSKPPGVGLKGTVLISFTIGAAGGLDDVRLARSSGDQRLDQLALDAVRSARFSAPPPGLTTADLSYEIPFRFR